MDVTGRVAASATRWLRAVQSSIDDERSRRSHVLVSTADHREGFALFGGFKARHRVAAVYLPSAGDVRTRIGLHRPATAELCRNLAARWGLVAFCGDSAPPGLESEILTIPVDVEMEMPTPGHGAHWSRSAKANIARVKRSQFSFDVVCGDAWVAEFRRRMHRPSMRNRHGARAYVVSRRAMARYAGTEGSELLRIFREGRWVAGSLNRSTPDGYRLWVVGWRDGDAAERRNGVISATYWFNFQRAAALGHRRILLGSVEPYLEDGILTYKGHWGATLSTRSAQFTRFDLLLDPAHPVCGRFLRSHSIITRGADGDYIVFSGTIPGALNVPPAVLSAVRRWYIWRDRPQVSADDMSGDVPVPLRRWVARSTC
jgi:hypothetical protein